MKNHNHSISIIIPAYNEGKGLGMVLNNIINVVSNNAINNEIIVVDDGSVDDTAIVAESTGVKVVKHEKNIGYGAALKTGIKASRFEYILIIDADGTYPENDIPILTKKIETADMVVGSRTKGKVSIPLVRRPAKWVLKILSQYLTGKKIPDLNSGLRIFRKKLVFQYFHLLPDKFSFTTTITVAMLNDNYRVKFIPIDYRKRVGKSKIVPWDFFSFFLLIVRLSTYFNPLKIFAPVSLICFFISFLKFCSDIYFGLTKYGFSISLFVHHPIVSITSVLFFTAGLQILLIGIVSDSIIRRSIQHLPNDL